MDNGKLLIALDIDGTIAEHNGTIKDETIEAIHDVQKYGHHIVLASGRSIQDIHPVLEQVGLSSEWLVSTNGAITFKNESLHMYDSKYVEFNVLEITPDKHVDHFRKIAPQANFMIEVHGEGFYYNGIFDMPYIDNVSKKKSSLEEFYGKKSLRLIMTDHIENENFWRAQTELYGEGLIGTYDKTSKVWLEILHHKANKADALETIRKELNIPLDNIVAAGDGHNDIKMLQWAGKHGRSYAMGQAHQDVKQSANNITETVENLGTAKMLHSLIDGQKI